MQDDKVLGLRCCFVDALTHPDWIGMVGIAVHHQQRRVAARDRPNIVPLIRKRTRHPSWNVPRVSGAIAGRPDDATLWLKDLGEKTFYGG